MQFFKFFFLFVVNLSLALGTNASTDVFGSNEDNQRSFLNWKSFYITQARSASLESIALLEREKQRKLRRLEDIDCYAPCGEENNPLYLEGIWQQVAYFDSSIRKELIDAYEGKTRSSIKQDFQKASFWKEFSGTVEDPLYTPAPVLNVAAYITELESNSIEAVKLEKLLYFAQKCFLKSYCKPLFRENIEAWVYGPVVPEVYRYHRGRIIVERGCFGSSDLTPEQRSSISYVVQQFENQRGWDLVELSHLEKVWIKARRGLKPDDQSNVVISIDDILNES